MDAAKYAATERLRDGASLEVRALRSDDRAAMLESIGRFSNEALHRRFFAPKRNFSEREIDFFLNVDFESHVALVAVLAEGGRPVIVGGSRYVVCRPGCAEVAFAIDDPHREAWYRHPSHHPSDQDRTRCRAQGIRRRSAAREHADAEGLPSGAVSP